MIPIKYIVAFLATSALGLFYLTLNSKGDTEVNQNLETKHTSSNYEDLNNSPRKHVSITPLITDANKSHTSDDKSSANSLGRELSDQDLIQIRKLRHLLDFVSVEEAIDAIIRGDILISSLTPSAKSLVAEILTPVTTPDQFDYLISINVIDTAQVDNYYERIFDNDAAQAEEWALEKFKILERYGTDISQLKRKVKFRNSTYEVAPLEKAASLGMSSVVDYFISRSTSYRNSEIAWFGILVNQKGDYLGSAKALLSAGYGPDPSKLNNILNEEFRASEPQLYSMLEEYRKREFTSN